jgi:spore photoproduct lyase
MDASGPAFAEILVELDARGSDLAATIRRNAPGALVTEASLDGIEERLRHGGISEGKRVLVVRNFRGRALKPCQGHKPRYACCGLHTLSEANGCALDCTYCILQHYVTTPGISVFANVEDLIEETARVVRSRPDRVFRITTGELGDSLLLDPLTEASRKWVAAFRRLPNAILELKTKTDHVGHLLAMEPDPKTVVSWSVNPPDLVEREELMTASLPERLAAAASVARHGFPVGFHLDPMVRYPGWEEGYRYLIAALLGAVPPDRIAWISLGSLRFPPEMKPGLVARFPGSSLRLGELLPCEDGKLRYPRPLRAEMFELATKSLDAGFLLPSTPPLVYLCMEPPATWRRVFRRPAPTSPELDHRFAETFRKRFPETGLPETRPEAYED